MLERPHECIRVERSEACIGSDSSPVGGRKPVAVLGKPHIKPVCWESPHSGMPLEAPTTGKMTFLLLLLPFDTLFLYGLN